MIQCKELQRMGQLHTENVVKQVYKPFTPEEISNKIAELITPKDLKIPVQVIFQTIESLHLPVQPIPETGILPAIIQHLAATG